MISEKLYELAFEYKKAKLWKALWDAELFAIKLSGGRIGYVSVAGARGDYCALALYIGKRGLGTSAILWKQTVSASHPWNSRSAS